jgi:restriction endonuclease S subunit
MSEKNCVKIIKEKYFLNDSGFTILSNNNNKLLNIYLWNYLILIKQSIFNTGVDLAQRNININKFKNIDVPVPTIEFQKYMEPALESFDKMDESLKKLLEDNDKYLETAFMNSFDDFGNPNTFNIHKLSIDNEIQELKPKKKVKSKQNKKYDTNEIDSLSSESEDEKPKKIIKKK